MKGNFDAIFKLAIGHEGGYVNDPNDPGGETKYGISKRAHPSEDIKGMTLDRAKSIYKRDYWIPLRCDDLPSGIDYVAFDGGINSGVSRGAKWVQRALGVTQDGMIGPKTIDVAMKSNAELIINRACIYRLDFMRGLSTWHRYKNGWSRRVDDVRSAAVIMTRAAPPAAKPKKTFWQIIMEWFK